MTASARTLSFERPATRLASIDIFRGITMTVMIFVNQLADVKGLPWWTYHMKEEVDFMTYVDMVFPFFLFIVGLSLPLAIKHRLKKNPSMPALWMHVAVRTSSLWVIGLILANAEEGDASRMIIRPAVWGILGILGAGLFLNDYGPSERRAGLYRGLRIFGLALVAAMFALFHHTSRHGHAGWIQIGYPEILGLIGYTYFAVALVYIPTRRWLWAPLGWFVAMMALNIFSAAHWVTFTDRLPYWIFPFENGAMAGITLAGIVTSNIFLGDHRWQALRQKMGMALAFGVCTLIAGWFLMPLGISKIRATPTWSLYSVGAAVLMFTALYWICDVKKKTGWAFFARTAGSNTLTTYLLPDLWDFALWALGIHYFATHLNYGWQGLAQAVGFTAMILCLSAILTRWKVRLRL